METLQNIVLPNLEVQGSESMYLRLNERAFCDVSTPCVRFTEGGEISTDTFYGGLTIGAWRRTSPVSNIVLELEGEGEFFASIGVHKLGCAAVRLVEKIIKLDPAIPLRIPVTGWKNLQEGMLFLRLRASTAGSLRSARYRTSDRAPNAVRLGLIITHFNRQMQVLPAIQRIRRDVLAAPEVRGSITLTVVDNSSNLSLVEDEVVTRIPSRNFGGSGGFARGLLSLEDDGRTTHGLFMDDDASCEAESILRTFALLRFAAAPNLAVAGALLDEAEPWRMLEKGACFDGKCRPLEAGRDVREVWQLLAAEKLRARPDYGGWWFFAFPIQGLKQYPFPFFVRGDDVFFSLGNRFELCTLNGIACLAEQFRLKHGPMTAYLDARYHLVHAVLREGGKRRILRRLINNQFVKPLLGYHYSSARAFRLALQHVSQGPQFFRDNLDLAAVRTDIGTWLPSEKMAAIPPPGLKLRFARHDRDRPTRVLLRCLTLQGSLLPNALLSRRLLVHEKTFYGRGSAVFRFRRVLYEHEASGTGFICELDRRRFFAEIGALAVDFTKFVARLPRLQREYRRALPQLASSTFWRRIFELPSTSTASAAPDRLRVDERNAVQA